MLGVYINTTLFNIMNYSKPTASMIYTLIYCNSNAVIPKQYPIQELYNLRRRRPHPNNTPNTYINLISQCNHSSKIKYY